MRVGGSDLEGGALLLGGAVRVRVHGREAGAALHEALEVEGDPVAGGRDLDAGDLVSPLSFAVVYLRGVDGQRHVQEVGSVGPREGRRGVERPAR